MLGFNAPVPYQIPHEHPRFGETVATLHPGNLRWPGGSVANFFDWRSGQLVVPVEGEASMYRRFMANMAGPSTRMHPNGSHAKEFKAAADAAGAELVWVANLESSSVEEQVEWARDMRAAGVAPPFLELGNEFYLALLEDPTSRARFPDWETTNALSREYAEALRPELPEGAKVAAQLAGSRFHSDAAPSEGMRAVNWQWDDDSRVEDWYEAVTVHPYPELNHTVTPGASAQMPGIADKAIAPLLARADAGLDRLFADVAERAPGKEIWVTEWGAGDIAGVMSGTNPRFNAMWLHTIARFNFSLLRNPAVTMSCLHALFFGDNLWALFVPDGPQQFRPVGPTEMLGWFGAAANGATHETLEVEGAPVHPGGGVVGSETYRETVAALLRKGGLSTVLVHHAGDAPLQLDVSEIASGEPSRVELMSAPDMAEAFADRLPVVTTLPPASRIDLPPWTIARITFED